MERPDARSGDEDGNRAVRAPLTGPALLAVQLLALGYSPEEIASVRQVAPEDVLGDLRAALAALGATTQRDAIAAARRRNLIT